MHAPIYSYWRYMTEQTHGVLGRFMAPRHYLNGPFESEGQSLDQPLPKGYSMKVCPIPTKDTRIAKGYIEFALLFQDLQIIKGKERRMR
jgi:hypothetical protein